jgi:hypothetical protein
MQSNFSAATGSFGPQHLIFNTDSMPQQLPSPDRRSMLAIRYFLIGHTHHRRLTIHIGRNEQATSGVKTPRGEGKKLGTASTGNREMD